MIRANYITTDGFAARNPSVDVSAYSATTLSGVITRASQALDDYLGYSLPIEVITGEKTQGMVDADCNLVVYPVKQPIISVEALAVVKGNITVNLSLTDGTNDRYDTVGNAIVYPDAALSITGASLIGTFATLRVTRFFSKLSYTAGYESVPSWAVDATDLYVMDRLARQQNTAGAKSVRQGQIAITYSDRTGKSDLAEDAEAILQDYRRVGGF